MFQNETPAYQLSIQMSSIQLSQSIAKNSDLIRISITTLPEVQKQAFHVKAKELYCFNHSFNVNITKDTKKIIVVFRKKGIFGFEDIIASTIISPEQFPQLPEDPSALKAPIYTEVTTVRVYEPINKKPAKKEKKTHLNDLYCQITSSTNVSRKVVGRIQVQFTLKNSSSYKSRNDSKQLFGALNYDENSIFYNKYDNEHEYDQSPILEIY